MIQKIIRVNKKDLRNLKKHFPALTHESEADYLERYVRNLKECESEAQENFRN